MPRNPNAVKVYPGSRFGRLLVVKASETVAPDKDYLWDCLCDCGTQCTKRISSLRRGTTRSCGCLARELSSKRNSSHRMSKSREYHIWTTIKQRCRNPKCNNYPAYGAKGIDVCDRWFNSFDAFLEDMGCVPEGMSIDRIDNAKGYEPSNCRWATDKEQQRNRRSNVRLAAFGEERTIVEWSEHTGISGATISYRLKHNWPAELALTTKPDPHNRAPGHAVEAEVKP